MKKINNKTNNLSVSAFCSDYIHNFNARELTKSWKRNAIKAVAIAGISSAMLSTQEAQAQLPFDCPPAFSLMEGKSFLFNPQGFTTTPYRTNPTFVDFDGDGDFDVIAGSGGILGGDDIVYFQNTGTNTSPNWAAPVLNPNGLSGLTLFGAFGSSNFAPTFADIDNDGDLDAFIATFNNGIIYQENIGTATSPNYAAGVTNPFGANVSGELLTAPALVDIDNDGDLDMFVGEVFNDIFFFENTGTASAPVFTASGTNQFGLDNTFQADYLPKLAFADLDNDGDYDAMVGGYYGNFTYFENTGNATTPSFGAPELNPFFVEGTGYYRTTVSFADTDNDGDLDMISGTEDGDYAYYENYGTSTQAKYAEYPFDLATPFSDTYNAIDYADMDNDGDIDLIVGNGFLSNDIFFVENVSTNPSMPSFAAPVLIASTITGYEVHPTVADIDGDGDFDILAGNSSGNFFYFQNTGNATNFNFGAPVTNPFSLFDVGTYATPEFADMDGDGDQDLFVGRKSAGGTLYFQNTGTATAPVYAAPVTNPFGLTSTAVGIRWSEVDIDNDGDLDFVYGDEDNTTFYLNTGTTTAPSFVNLNTNFGFDDSLETDYSPIVVDIDQDGFYEAFIGNKRDRLFVYENVQVLPEVAIAGATTINTFCEPVTLSATSPNTPLNNLTVSWFDASNNQLVATGATFTYTPTQNGSMSFYATAKSTTTGCETATPSATVTITSVEPIVRIVGNSTVNTNCEPVTLTAVSDNFLISNLIIKWYDAATNQQVAQGQTYTYTPTQNGSKSFYIKAEASTQSGCSSQASANVTVTSVTPLVRIAGTNVETNCEPVTLTALSDNFQMNNLTVKWYNANTNQLVGQGQTYTFTPTQNGDTYFYAQAEVTGQSGCISAPSANVRVRSVTPAVSILSTPLVEACTATTLTATSQNYDVNELEFTWYNAATNSVVGQGQTYTFTPVEVGSESFYVVGRSVNSSACVSVASTSVTVACDFGVSTNLSATAGYGTAMLSWTVTKEVANIPAEISGYEVYADFGNTGQFFLVGIASTTAYEATYEAVGLVNGVETTFKVRPIFRGTGRGYGAYSNTVTVLPSIILGEEDNKEAGFAFYPNPNNGEFNLKLQDGTTAAKVSVINLSGQLVHSTDLTSTQSSINLGNVASGMYIVRVETANGMYQQKVSIVR